MSGFLKKILIGGFSCVNTRVVFDTQILISDKKMAGDKIISSIVKMVNETNRNDTIYTHISDELDEFKNEIVQFEQSFRGISENSTGRETTNEKKRRCT